MSCCRLDLELQVGSRVRFSRRQLPPGAAHKTGSEKFKQTAANGGKTDSAQPESEKLDSAQPESGEQDSAQPESGKQDSAQPGDGEQDSAQSGDRKSDSAKPKDGKANTFKTDREEASHVYVDLRSDLGNVIGTFKQRRERITKKLAPI